MDDVVLWIVVGTALAFDFTNGFHDTANSIATSVSTRAMSPRAAVLSAASLASAAGLDALGTALGGLVAALALLAAVTGLCVGCEAYKLGYRLTGRRFVSCPLPPQPAPSSRSL